MPREIGEMAIYSVAFHENSGKVLVSPIPGSSLQRASLK